MLEQVKRELTKGEEEDTEWFVCLHAMCFCLSVPLFTMLLSSSPLFTMLLSMHLSMSLNSAVTDDSRLMEAQEALLKEQMENEELKQQVEFLNSVIVDLQVSHVCTYVHCTCDGLLTCSTVTLCQHVAGCGVQALIVCCRINSRQQKIWLLAICKEKRATTSKFVLMLLSLLLVVCVCVCPCVHECVCICAY